MLREEDPEIGVWYETDEGEIFIVLAFDERSEAIDVQYSNGTVDMLDLGTWKSMDVQPIEMPEHWQPSMDNYQGRRRYRVGD